MSEPPQRPVVVDPEDSIEDVVLLLHDDPAGVALVASPGGEPTEMVVDTDLRRAVLAGADRTAPVRPHVRPLDESRLEQVSATAQPPASAVVLAGGRGQRLQPVTDTVPKPLLMVGRTTILERMLDRLARAGITDVHLSVNYKAEAIEQRVGDGSAYGVNVTYLREHKVLHTAGALSLLPSRPAGPLVVLNAKLVTSLDFARVVDFHREEQAAMTVGAMEYGVQIPYGVLRLDGPQVTAIDEKPTLRTLCSAGIYVLSPEVVDLVPRNTFFGMPELIDQVLRRGDKVVGFPVLEKIINISTREELEEALLYFATGEEI
jgi:NDP-sugar pyrophosphorylase family protein